MMNLQTLRMTSIGAALACMSVVGCSKQDQADASRNPDRTVAQADQRANDPGSPMNRAKDAARQGAMDAKDKVSDAVITTTVKSELAKDPNLSALNINVDTDSGRVALHGTAPSPEARDHASALAAGVKGVVGVDNELRVDRNAKP